MSRLSVYDMKGVAGGNLEIDDALLVLKGAGQAVHDAVVAHRGARRAGSASTLGKGAVAGSNKKPWRQKGTGRARAGYRQSPIWRGGGVAFGPHPRSFAKKVPKKLMRLAFARALSGKIGEGTVKVVDKVDLSEPKTRLIVEMLRALGVKGGALIVLERADRKVSLAVRNLPRVEVTTAGAVSVYEVLRHPVLIADKAAVEVLKERLGRVA